MSFYKFINCRESWEAFLEKEEQREFTDAKLIRQINKIIKTNRYADFTEQFLSEFKIPHKVQLSKINSSKKRTVYIYPNIYRTILKITSYYMLQHYNNIFCSNSLAYTEGRSVKSAFNLLNKYNITGKDIIYKTDFSDYFNTINIDLLEPKLKAFLKNDQELFEFIMSTLRNDKVIVKNNEIVESQKGVMAGSPIAGILANIYMHDVDSLMYRYNYKYIRYADDVLVIGKEAYDFFLEQITPLDIHINQKKTQILNIKTGITFLGFYFKDKTIDVSPDAIAKMKSRLKRRAKWYRIWMQEKNVPLKSALRDYIIKLNFKLYSNQDDSINWSRWYLPNINTTKSLEFLDKYFISCIRFLESGKWQGKHHFNLKYDKIKKLGFKSLVNEYYKLLKHKKETVELAINEDNISQTS